MSTATDIPFGYCHCGCGERTNLIERNDFTAGRLKGEPCSFIAGHQKRKCNRWEIRDCGYATPCHVWLLAMNGDTGYGLSWDSERKIMRGAHCLVWEAVHGPVPDGLVLDHLCRVRSCVNPAHLEPVTNAENIRRGRAGAYLRERTHCPAGHPYSGDNLLIRRGGQRGCRTCLRRQKAEHWQRKRLAAEAPSQAALHDLPDELDRESVERDIADLLAAKP